MTIGVEIRVKLELITEFYDISLDFVMCNPPFYESQQELIASATAKQRPPFSVNKATLF